MALITCPECGRKNVSDSAVACPDCGFGIREYYTHLQEQQQKEEKEKEYREHARSVSQSLDDDIKKHQARRAEILAQKEAQEKEKSISESLTDQETIDLEKLEYDREQLRKRNIEQNRIEVARKKQELIIKKLKKEYNDYKLLCIVFVLCGTGLIIFMAVLGFLYAPSAIVSIIMLLIGFLSFSIMDEKKKT